MTVGITGYSQMEVERMIENATSEGVFERVILDRVLKEMAAEVATPMIVDDITTLLRMEADGDTIRYVYEISSDPETLSIPRLIEKAKISCKILSKGFLLSA